MKRLFTLLFLSSLCFIVQANTEHPLINAYPEASLRKQLSYDYETFRFPTTVVSESRE